MLSLLTHGGWVYNTFRLAQEKFPELDVKTHKAEIDALTTRIFTAGASGDEEVSRRCSHADLLRLSRIGLERR
jgi:ATP-dependent 26S proteasome regulatory subunit